MGGKSGQPAPIAPPTPVPDEKAKMQAPSTAPGAIQAAQEEEKKKQEAGATLGSATQAKPMQKKKDPASYVATAPSGGVASSAVLTG